MFEQGTLLGGIRLSTDKVTLNFDIPEPTPTSDKVVGIDIGQKSILAVSTGQSVDADIHGHTFQSICTKMKRKKKGSKAFARCQKHRQNFINWSLNQLDWSNIGQINREDIKNLRLGRRTSRSLGHWTYSDLVTRLDQKAEEHGVRIVKLSPTYTSQRCSACGWVRKNNRKGKKFVCTNCGHTADADHNASLNLSLTLSPLGGNDRRLHKNLKGFFWSCQEPIVPGANKLEDFSIS